MRALSALLTCAAILLAHNPCAQGAVGDGQDIREFSSQEFTSEVKKELRQWDERLAMVKAGAMNSPAGGTHILAIESELEALREGIRRDLHFLKVEPHLSPHATDFTRSRIRSRFHRMDIEYRALGMN